MFGYWIDYAEEVTEADIAAALAGMKAALLADGFVTVAEDATSFTFAPPGNDGRDADDAPIWKLAFTAYSLSLQAIWSDGVETRTGGTSQVLVQYTDGGNVPLFCAGSAREGWFWCASADDVVGPKVAAAVISRRYPSDTSTGLIARFGVVRFEEETDDGLICLWPYASDYGLVTSGCSLMAVSPLGVRGAPLGTPSTLPRMMAPLFALPANIDGFTRYSAAAMGELQGAMMATSGYNFGEVAAPGWRVFGGGDACLALPCPTSLQSEW